MSVPLRFEFFTIAARPDGSFHFVRQVGTKWVPIEKIGEKSPEQVMIKMPDGTVAAAPAFFTLRDPCYTVRTLVGSGSMVKQFKIIVERHADGYVAYPIGLKGVVVGEGESYEEALADVRSAIQFHVETFGPDVFESEQPVLEAFIAETGIPV
jgi:predicted RNase H-like HicB family nuclease